MPAAHQKTDRASGNADGDRAGPAGRGHVAESKRLRLGGSSSAVSRTAKPAAVAVAAWRNAQLRLAGIKPGMGIRQGMPLSPFLANVALMDFDKAIIRRGFPMVRYADDISMYFDSKAECESALETVRDLLAKQGLTVPSVQEASKTTIVSALDPVVFLGREIVFLEREDRYVARVGKEQLRKIRAQLDADYRLQQVVGAGQLFGDTLTKLRRSVSAYLGAYKDCYNYAHVESELLHTYRLVVSRLFDQIFGERVMGTVSDAHKRFLGYWDTQEIEAHVEYDVI
jgi:RNA-directed DNA polymerase